MNPTAILATAILRDLDAHPAPAERTERNCLTCSRPFISDGPYHRVCDRCKSGRDNKLWEFVN